MRKIPGKAAVALLALLTLAGPAVAGPEDVYYLDRGDNGFTLPGVTLPQGQDEVHASDGTTCRSAVGGSGSYLDVGAINSNMRSNGEIATYGRIVVPLGRQTKRLDCTKLYELEVERLKMELELLKMGLAGETGGARPKSGAEAAKWAQEGWSDAGVAAK